MPPEKIELRYYLRFKVADRPHVIADIADILGRQEISLASIIQHEAPEVDETESGDAIVTLVIMTHRTTESRLRAATDELERLPTVTDRIMRMPVAD